MLKNYLKVAFRNVLKYKGFSFINVTGLAVGMASCIIILLWIQAELSFDKFHKNVDNIYRMYQVSKYSGDQELVTDNLPGVLAETIREEYPEVERTTRFLSAGSMPVRYGEKYFNEKIRFTEADFFKIFSFPLKSGDIDLIFDDPSSVVITENIAKKYFGNEDPLEKYLTIDNKIDLKVTGVLYDLPNNTHLSNIDILIHFSKTLDLMGESFSTWGSNWPRTYLQLKAGTIGDVFDKKITNLLSKHQETNAELHIQPLTKIKLYTLKGEPGLLIYIYVFTGIAFIVLLIACFNFINLSVARSNIRGKEVGLRKVIGAKKSNIIFQFFGESILTTMFALVIAIIIILLTIPLINNTLDVLTGSSISFNVVKDQSIIIMIMGIAILTGILSGLYPSLLLSSFQPAIVLKGTKKSPTSKANLKSVIVISQFVVSIVLIIGSFIIYDQLSFLQERQLGFNKDNLLYMPMRDQAVEKYSVLRKELLKNPIFTNVTSTSRLPVSGGDSGNPNWENKNPEKKVLINGVDVDYNYIEAMEMEIIEGRTFRRKSFSDTSGRVEVILNEQAAKIMEIDSPIGKWFGDPNYATIIGIVKDFHFASLKRKIAPMVIFADPKYSDICMVRIKTGDIAEAIKYVEKSWKEINPNLPFSYGFLDEELTELYGFENKIAELIRYFTGIAILIACLGLYGLASFTIERRTKEIGIRKTLGASVHNIVGLISGEFLWQIIVACFLAWPIAYFSMQKWLEDFAYRIDLGFFVFLLSSILVLIIALFTIMMHSIKAATANPVNSLRNE